ncbi:MAG: OmpA family protein [Paludibacteraceae bacterium]|nr:OmpA family protein [Paludibacteraceae bacterium]
MTKTKTILFLTSVILLGVTLSSCGVKARIKKADKKFAIGEYYEAGNIYQSAYRQVSAKDKPTRAYVAFRQGECYRNINNTRAVTAYRNAIRNRYPDSIVYLRHAQVLHYQGKYQDAAKSYEIFLQSHPDDYVAQGGLFACRQINEWKKQSSRYKIAPEKDFNQKRSSNFAACFIGDDADAVVFTSNRTPASKKNLRNSSITGVPVFSLYSTRKNALGTWEDIEPLSIAEANTADSSGDSEGGGNDEGSGASLKADKAVAELGACCFTADGKTMYFTYSKPVNGSDQGAKIFVSDRASGEWGEPREIKLFSDSTITCGHPSLSADGDTLFFVSDAPGGYGGKDIWYAEYDGGEWVGATNLGPQINTSGDEMYPTIRRDGSLYFASNGHPGYGGLDLFKAVPQDSTWILFNLGAPFNSAGDDFAINFEGNTENGFFSSNRGQKKGYDLIYRFTLPEMILQVEGTVTDNNGENLTDAMLRLIGDDGTIQRLQVKRDGTYRIKLKKDVRYAMLVTARGYLNEKQTLTTMDAADSYTYRQDFSLSPISRPVTMDNIFYEFAKWTLTPASEEGLNQLIKLLNDNPNITIELSAHTDRVGNAEANKILSEKRAQSVVDYLIQHGIDRERLTPVGYGKEKPVVADKALSQKYPFIPLEQELNEQFIDGLTKEQQDICNQINRRTEFKVLKTTYKLY